MEEKDYWIGFSVFSGVGPVTFQNLLRKFSSAKSAWLASESHLKEIFKEKKTQDFLNFRERFDFGAYKRRLEKTKVSIVTLQDAHYPSRLKQIKNPPFVLYVKGRLEGVIPNLFRDPKQDNKEMLKRVQHDSLKVIAIVGTRKITQYGRDVTEMFTHGLVSAGFTIVSGLAMGVDAIAHQTALDIGGETIAVLGCGVDCVYPRENEKLYDAIIESGGVILSEVPLGMSASIGTFPARNRIVAGLSEGILVTEGAEDSGALITAEFGLQYGRKVFAVPGPITSSLSKGPYKLIEKGAKLVTSPADVLKKLGIKNKELRTMKEKIIGETKEEQMIIDLLENEPLLFDEIVRRTKYDSATIASLISLMEIKGVIVHSIHGEVRLVY